ncbi:MAG: phenylalanine--tRNA ligase subunit beta [Ignavibacteria bacterium]|nr:phenylalanine--tRNA ligase subunit beta [Ignavibacteria bacterium]
MRISLNWIKNYIPGLSDLSVDYIKERMIAIGLDIESVESERAKFENIVIAEILEVIKIPKSDKLTLCKVNDGSTKLDVVCGAPNVKVGQKVCLAKIGAVIPLNNLKIEKTKIRGVTSEGMLCAEDELGISDDHSGIMVVDSKAKVGTPFADYIGANDYIFEIALTPNRGDLLSHFGIAREIASAVGLEFIKPEIKLQTSSEKSSDYISITIENKEFCKRFTGRVVKNVKIKESPDWLKKYLIAVGLRPRNNIVDITNFVMMETGQPLHAFDYDKIRGKQIIVKTAKEGDKFITLDSKERILNEYSLMVCDAEGPSAIAGVMGGELSEITENTKNVFIESAFFDPICIRRNSKKLNLITDASQRFERGVDIENVVYASNRAAQLMSEIAGGEVLDELIDVYPEPFKKLHISLRPERVQSLLGKEISEDEIINSLESIGIMCIEKLDKNLIFEIPEYRRHDLTREVDLIEEIARLHGYDNFENDYSIKFNVADLPDYNDSFNDFLFSLKEYFIGRGFNEIITYSQQDEKYVKLFSDKYVTLQNPNSVEMNTMRVNLVYGLLETMKLNFNNSGRDISLKLFEIGKVFHNEETKFSESYKLCFGIGGYNDYYGFDIKDRKFDFFDLKGEIELFYKKLNLENDKIIYYNSISSLNRIGELYIDDTFIGNAYYFNGDEMPILDKGQEVFLCEIDIEPLFKCISRDKKYKEIFRYPPVKRDLALLVSNNVYFNNIKDVILKESNNLLSSLKLFDIYRDEKLGENVKSIALTLEFNSTERTLTDEEVNLIIDKIVNSLNKQYGIKLRQ